MNGMNKLLVFLVFVQISFGLEAQKLTFSQLGFAEKWWVATHPSAAVKAKKLTKKVMQLTDSIAKADSFPNLKSGGEKDAFRHALWLAVLSKEIGTKKALKLGKAHEKTNRKDFKKGRKEEGAVPDSAAERMDLFNNEMGAIIADSCVGGNAMPALVQCVKSKLYQGKLRIIKMNEQGTSLDAENRPIPREEWEGKWANDRMLVPSDNLLKDQSQN
jgi:hypothetical protein